MYAKLKPYLLEYGLALLLSLVAAALLFAPAWLTSSLIYAGDYTGSDLLDMNLPLRFLAAQTVKEGNLPFWSPQIGCGFPLLAEGQAGVFYPTTLPLFLFFSVAWASNLSIISALAWASFGGYVLGRVHGLSRSASALTALTIAFSPILVFRLKHLNMLQAAVWLPLSFSAIKLICTHAPLASNSTSNASVTESFPASLAYRSGLILLALCWTMQILAGHPHAACVCGLGALTYACLLWLKRLNSTRRNFLQNSWPIAKALLLSALISVALSGLQLLPTAELASQSSRGHVYSWDSLKMFPFTWEHFKLFLDPFTLGNPANVSTASELKRNVMTDGVFWESMPYLGWAALLFMPYALWRRRHLPWEIGVATLIFLVLAMGPQGYLYWLPWKLCPGFSLFRFPARFLMPFGTMTALWLGCGFDALLSNWPKKWSLRYQNLASLTLLVAVWANFYWTTNAYVTYLPTSIFERPLTADMCAQASRLATPTVQNHWASLVQKRGWKNCQAAIISLFHSLSPDSAVFWGIKQNINRTIFEGGMCLTDYNALQNESVSSLKFGQKDGQKLIRIDHQSRLLYKLQNVSHLLAFETAVDADLTPYEAIGETELPGLLDPLRIYKINEPKPRAYLASSYVKNLPAMPTYAFLAEYGSTIEYGDFVALHEESERRPQFYATSPQISQNQIKNIPLQDNEYCHIIQNKTLELKLDINTTRERALLFTENRYPAWQAELDGKKLPIFRANLAFMGCLIPPGHHTVRFKFVPHTFYWGCLTSLIGLLMLAWQANGILAQSKAALGKKNGP